MSQRHVLVVTSQLPGAELLRRLALDAAAHGASLLVVGDAAGPQQHDLSPGRYLGLDEQRRLPFRCGRLAPTSHHARKNLGYLLAMQQGAEVITDLDDDVIPLAGFWRERSRTRVAAVLREPGWCNTYRYFTEQTVWPRGFPLGRIKQPWRPLAELMREQVDAPIQHGLVNDDPDVDAVYRMTAALPVRFGDGPGVALSRGAWCPFNSQNTTWWREAFALLYLPGTTTFRITDIWRGLIAQRIAWERGWQLLFDGPDVRHQPNAHDLQQDFVDELPAMLHNGAIAAALAELQFSPVEDGMLDQLQACYRRLVEGGWLDRAELDLLAAWREDLEQLS